MVPEPGDPQSLNRYAYVRNNPLRYNDPSGHCKENGDEACWGVYEQIIALCPQCASLSRPGLGKDIPLDQDNIVYLQTVLHAVKRGWRPPRPEPVVIGVSINGGRLKHFSIGMEKLINPKTGNTTVFLVLGVGGGLGGGGSLQIYSGTVQKLSENLSYSGNFVSVYAVDAQGIGVSTNDAITLRDVPNIPHPVHPHVWTTGLAFGVHTEVGGTLTEYIPLWTRDEHGNVSWDVDDYFFSPTFDEKYRGVIGNKVFHTFKFLFK